MLNLKVMGDCRSKNKNVTVIKLAVMQQCVTKTMTSTRRTARFIKDV